MWKEKPLENLGIGHFASVLIDPQAVLKEVDMQNIIRKQFLAPRVPNFHTFHFTINCFEDIGHFMILSLTTMLKLQSATQFLKHA